MKVDDHDDSCILLWLLDASLMKCPLKLAFVFVPHYPQICFLIFLCTQSM